MGAGTSKQKLGERVVNARKKLEADAKMQEERTKQIHETSPETLEVMVQSIADSFARCAPFSEPLLLVAFEANPEEVERIVAKACKKVLSAPIRKAEFRWFQQYVYPSSIWLMRNRRDELLFERMLAIAKSMSEKIDNSMDSIFAHLQLHKEWHTLLSNILR